MLDYKKNSPVRFYKGDENRVVEETCYDSESIFSSQYDRAIDIIRGFWHDGGETKYLSTPNIVAFCGERGEGKTSCMMSVTKQLPRSFDNEMFEILEPIDPSFFDEQHNIMELVLGQMYSRFLRAKGYADKREEVLINFNRVKNCLRTLTKGSENVYDAIEELDELGNSMSLKSLMGQLIDSYLEYVDKEILLVVIDDMDYNWSGAFEMTQMIYKYLSHNNCILFISVSIGQMVEVIETSFKNELRPMGNNTNFYEVAYKYVEKLIPLQYRVEMPHVYDLCDRKLEIYRNRGDEKPIAEYKTIKEGVVNEIFVKTRYLFYNYQDGVSQIVPRNLRMLRQLLGMLNNMDIYHKDSEDPVEREAGQQNKLMFQSFFFTNWTRQLNKMHRGFVKTLMNLQDVSQVNKMVVSYLKNLLPQDMIPLFFDITKETNYSYNISVGDVFTMLNYIERNPKDDNDQLMVFFLKSYYSMLFYHYYDEITEDVKALHSEEDQSGIYRTDSWFKGTNKLQRFVNGSYFQYNHGDLLRGKVEINESFEKRELTLDCDQFCVDYNEPKDLMESVRRIIQRKNSNLTDDDKAIVNRAELFILMVLWGSEREISSDVKKQRDFPQPHHLVRFNEQTVSYMFDVMAPFTNHINLKFAYDRFKSLTGDLYHFAYEREWSLLRQMMAAVVDQNEKNLGVQEMRLASDALIRNAEVLTSMKEKILSLASSGGDATDFALMIADFYEKIMNSEMVTYPTAPGEEPYTINFSFLKPVCKLLREDRYGYLYSLVMQKQLMREKDRGSSSSDL